MESSTLVCKKAGIKDVKKGVRKKHRQLAKLKAPKNNKIYDTPSFAINVFFSFCKREVLYSIFSIASVTIFSISEASIFNVFLGDGILEKEAGSSTLLIMGNIN